MEDKFVALKGEIEKLFGASTDEATIKQAAVVATHIDELKADNDALIKRNGDLLQDYKQLVLTASYKPQQGENLTGGDTPKARTFEEALKDFKKGINK